LVGAQLRLRPQQQPLRPRPLLPRLLPLRPRQVGSVLDVIPTRAVRERLAGRRLLRLPTLRLGVSRTVPHKVIRTPELNMVCFYITLLFSWFILFFCFV
jgi:hypothetical protein